MTLPTPVTKGLTFILGLGFAFLPAYGPFVALLTLITGRWALRRSDLLWWGAALLLALPLGVHRGLGGFVFGVLQVLAPWLLYRAFAKLHGSQVRSSQIRSSQVHGSQGHGFQVQLESSWIGLGLLTGLALIVALGLYRSLGGLTPDLAFWREQFGREPLHAQPQGSLFGHMVLTLGALVAVLLPQLRWQLLSLTLAALGVLVSGSREAAIAWMIVAAALTVVGPARTPRTPRVPRRRLVTGAFSVMILVGVALLGPLFGWGNAGFLIDVAPAAVEDKNLLQGTEVVPGDWWNAVGVAVEDTPLTFSQASLTGYLIRKVEPGANARLQQVITLTRGEPYTVSLWLWADNRRLEPGVLVRAQTPNGSDTFLLQGTLSLPSTSTARPLAATVGVADQRKTGWQAAVTGPGRVLDAGMLETRGLWHRVYVTFVYEGSAPRLGGWLGFAPDRRVRSGSEAAFAGLQLEQGLSPTPYTPGAVAQGLSLQRTRITLWQTAWAGFVASPLWGQAGNFADFFRTRWPDGEVPTHARSLPLQILFERGLFGFAGLLLFVVALGQVAVQKGDAAFVAVLSALLAANIFDVTLFSGQILYPLAAVAGWRAAAYRDTRAGERDSGMRQLGVRVALLLTDFVMVLLAFNLAIWLRQWSTGWFGLTPINPQTSPLELTRYALLLWPAMAWREGLYPGYGLTEPQELSKQIVSAGYAGLILAVGTVLFNRELTIPRSILLLTIFLSMVLTPLGRAVMKRLLHRLRLWGRAVVILGAGQAGARVARALNKSPLDGLHPVAFFDDDAAKQGQIIEGLRVRGKLADADLYAIRRGVQHAIVAIPTATPQLLGGLINTRGRIFRRVQFIPDLVNLPSQGVFASDLDGMLALEVRLGLYSRFNQVVKRTVDLTGGVLGGLLISPVLLALALWVRLDSPGSSFYWSTRIGQKGKPFKCLKFRSMYTDADERLQAMLRDDPAVRLEYERFHKLENDPRITRAGSLIRKYSLDELTQLFNVVKGEMSLVGPRPYLVQELPDMRGLQDVILEAKPGMTGFWQVTGRSNVTFGERLEMESQYVRNWSLWWDIVLLVKTVTVVVARQGAR